jgi:FG-GAP repeat protein
MTRVSRRGSFPTRPMLLLASLFLGACGGGGDNTPLTTTPASTQQIVTQLVQQGYLKASNTNADDVFGQNVALAGDTLVVGAYQERSSAVGVNGNQADNSEPNAGAVYVFTRTAGLWTQQAYLKASNTNAVDGFGYSVALSGDTLVVGAPWESSNATGVNGNQSDNSALYAGAVYVFTRTAGVWTQQAYLKASNTDAGDNFGINVTLVGDTLAVGAYEEASNATGVNGNEADNSAPLAGAVYVFTRTAGAWTQQAYLKASNGGGLFGYTLALAGEDTLAVGAPWEGSNATGVNGNDADTSAPLAGAVYVFTRTAGAWTQQAYLKASNTDAGDRFGQGLAIDGDTLVAGARFEASAASGVNGDQSDNSAPIAGAVYVFTRTAGAWTQQAYLKPSNAGANQNFGGSVAIAGDLVVVGARLEDSNATGINGDQKNSSAPDSGAVYLFTRSGGLWTQKDYLKATNSEAGDEFGVHVALSGTTLAVGALYEGSNATGVNGNQADNSAPNSGAVYVFDGL